MASRFPSVFTRTRALPPPPRPSHNPRVLVRKLHNLDSDLLEQLSSVLGLEQARQELRWMRESLNDHSGSSHSSTNVAPSPFRHARRDQPRVDQAYFRDAIANMIHRRLKGEPLQYILGMSHS